MHKKQKKKSSKVMEMHLRQVTHVVMIPVVQAVILQSVSKMKEEEEVGVAKESIG